MHLDPRFHQAVMLVELSVTVKLALRPSIPPAEQQHFSVFAGALTLTSGSGGCLMLPGVASTAGRRVDTGAAQEPLPEPEAEEGPES